MQEVCPCQLSCAVLTSSGRLGLNVKCILHVLIFLYTHETYRSSACPSPSLESQASSGIAWAALSEMA